MPSVFLSSLPLRKTTAEGALEIPKYAWCNVSAVSQRHEYVRRAHPCVGLLADVDLVRRGGAGELLRVPDMKSVNDFTPIM